MLCDALDLKTPNHYRIEKESFWFVISWLLENSFWEKKRKEETSSWRAKIRKLIIRDGLIMVSEPKEARQIVNGKGCVNFYQSSFFYSFRFFNRSLHLDFFTSYSNCCTLLIQDSSHIWKRTWKDCGNTYKKMCSKLQSNPNWEKK